MALLIVLGDELVADDSGQGPPRYPGSLGALLGGAVLVKDRVHRVEQLYRFFARSPPSAPSRCTNFIGKVPVKAFGVMRRARS